MPLLALLAAARAPALDWLTVLPLHDGVATVPRPPDGELRFLRFGRHAFAPAPAAPDSAASGSILVAPFQQLWIDRYGPPVGDGPLKLTFGGASARDAFWDELILAHPAAATPLPRYGLVEAGAFGEALPAAVRRLDLADDEVARQQAGLLDPVIPPEPGAEIPWTELEAASYPLDFQKVLLAVPNDPSPGFAYQNGQWFTTWPAADLAAGCREDHWFAPALLVGDKLVRPAPLAACTAFAQAADGTTVPVWTLEWSYQGMVVRQRLYSHRPSGAAEPRVHVQLQLERAPEGVRLALGLGRRPSAHYWDCTPGPRTPVPYFSLAPDCSQEGAQVRDARGHVVLAASGPFELSPLGPLEMLLVFARGADGPVEIETPQTPLPAGALPAVTPAAAEAELIRDWAARETAGARVRVPDPEWQRRIDLWRSQVESITRVTYDGRERLSYGAYFYQAYFGIEEAWPVAALAYWGRGDEARRQADIMLEPENLDKSNVHHQSRNGAGPLAAATVARLTGDRAWLERIAPALRACAQWTLDACRRDEPLRPALTRGLLPPHIYGGDVRDAATSLYATAACWRGLAASADAFRELGSPALAAEGGRMADTAAGLQRRLAEAFRAVTVRDRTPSFVPLALALPSLGGKNEGPYARLTDSRYGNYWNLFAPSFLELDYRDPDEPREPNGSIFGYAEHHGGLWAGLPRFYSGLDAAYAVGHISYLLERTTREPRLRPQALAAVESFMLHAASRNGCTVPEVAGLFPDRLQAAAYERVVREAPWSFGMYDAGQYLAGHISFTEPLGAGAGEGLILLRHALLAETHDALGRLDGGLVILPAVPSDWLAEGQEIRLEDMPTFYGRLSATIRSSVDSRREIRMSYRFKPLVANQSLPLKFRLRLAAPGVPLQEVEFVPQPSGEVRASF